MLIIYVGQKSHHNENPLTRDCWAQQKRTRHIVMNRAAAELYCFTEHIEICGTTAKVKKTHWVHPLLARRRKGIYASHVRVQVGVAQGILRQTCLRNFFLSKLPTQCNQSQTERLRWCLRPTKTNSSDILLSNPRPNAPASQPTRPSRIGQILRLCWIVLFY